jgi:hypothetical protein
MRVARRAFMVRAVLAAGTLLKLAEHTAVAAAILT